MTLFLGLEWFALALRPGRHRLGTERQLARGGAQVSHRGRLRLRGAPLRLGARLRRHRGARLRRDRVRRAVPRSFLFAGLAMILAGLAFKVSAAPFHMWTPDVLPGAPSSVTAFMSRRRRPPRWWSSFACSSPHSRSEADVWTIAVAVIACISLVWGNLAALAQRDVKRLLAYSSISHAGFMLMAISADSARGGEALLYYLVPYSAMSVGAFAVVAARERGARPAGDARVARRARVGAPLSRHRDVDVHARYGRLPAHRRACSGSSSSSPRPTRPATGGSCSSALQRQRSPSRTT